MEKNLVDAFFKAVSFAPDAPLFATKHEGSWQQFSRKEIASEVIGYASLLHDLGVKAGERVVIVSENRPEWAIAELAIMSLGAIAVPAYTSNTTEDHRYIIEHSEAVVAIISGTSPLAERVLTAASSKDLALNTVICLDSIEDKIKAKLGKKRLVFLDEIKKIPRLEDLEKRVKEVASDAICCLIYTSGTGGRPKGVMLTHGSIQANVDAAKEMLSEAGSLSGQRFLSLLPLAHSYEHMAGLHLPIQIGAEIWYSEGADRLANNLLEVSPTLMTAVPRLYEVLYDRITQGVKAKGGVSEKLFNAAVAIGRRRLSGKRSFGDRLVDPLLDLLVRRKVKKRFGGRLRYFISGGAALNPDIGSFFLALGVNVLQGYGQTEASPLISVNRPNLIKIETVGPPVDGVEVKISDEGEILAKGNMLMQGYWKDEKSTKEALKGGWLHTGDLGMIDEDGYIVITGRSKDIIVLSGGDNVAPSKIEQTLLLEPQIEQAMVDGDKQPFLVAVLVASDLAVEQAGGNSEALNQIMNEAVARANKNLSSIERVRHFILADEAFTQDNEQLTPTLKVRRHVVREVYRKKLEALYPKKQV